MFFKGLAAFVTGVVGAKVSSYIPNKEEPKEEVLVPSQLTIHHEGKEYHPLVVERTELDKFDMTVHRYHENSIGVPSFKHSLRKANI